MQRRLLNPAGRSGAGVLFCCSDRADRIHGASRCVVNERDMRMDRIRRTVGSNGYRAISFPFGADCPRFYGKTMQTYGFAVVPSRPTTTMVATATVTTIYCHYHHCRCNGYNH